MYSNLLISKGSWNTFYVEYSIAQSLVKLTMLALYISQGILVCAVIYTVINIGWLLDMALFRKQADSHHPMGSHERYHSVPTDLSGGVIGTSYFLTIGLL